MGKDKIGIREELGAELKTVKNEDPDRKCTCDFPFTGVTFDRTTLKFKCRKCGGNVSIREKSS